MEEKPSTPDLPKYLREPLEKQSPERLDTVAAYASDLAEWKRGQREAELEQRRAEEEVDEEVLEELSERDISTDPEDYSDVPGGAYITVKTTKKTNDANYRYYYWQWREADSWKNEYIAPVNPRE
jgi:hypothetical protein